MSKMHRSRNYIGATAIALAVVATDNWLGSISRGRRSRLLSLIGTFTANVCVVDTGGPISTS